MWAKYLLSNKCPLRLYDSFRTVLIINAINGLTTAFATWGRGFVDDQQQTLSGGASTSRERRQHRHSDSTEVD